MRRKIVGLLTFLGASTGGGLGAQAYECAAVPNGTTQAWVIRCIPYSISNAGRLTSSAMENLIAESFEVWSSPSCTDLHFASAGYSSDTPGFDPSQPTTQTNLVTDLESIADVESYPATTGILALTLTSFSRTSGEILDADILLNMAEFKIEDIEDPDLCPLRASPPYDLRSTLVHEIGHFIGFDHDENADSTMFARASSCEVKKRDLTEDNLAGLCDVYPAGLPTQTCQPPASGYDGDNAPPTEFRHQCERLESEGPSCSCANSNHAQRRHDRTEALVSMSVILGLIALTRKDGTIHRRS